MKLGDFSNLAKAYSKSRPGYSENVLSAILGFLNIPLNELEIVCPLGHPSSDSTPFGTAVLQRAAEGGGWLT